MSIASQFCGQMQPHAAHWWRTPQPYLSMQPIESNQCAGFSGYQPTPAAPEEPAARGGTT